MTLNPSNQVMLNLTKLNLFYNKRYTNFGTYLFHIKGYKNPKLISSTFKDIKFEIYILLPLHPFSFKDKKPKL